MHMLSIVMAGRETAIPLWFKNGEKAIAARDRVDIAGETIDDYGHHVRVKVADIVGLILTDVEREHEAQGEMALLQARAQASLQTRASADPGLRLAASVPRRGGLVG